MHTYTLLIDLHNAPTGDVHYYVLRFYADQLDLLDSILARQAADRDNPLTADETRLFLRLAREMVSAEAITR